MGAAYGSGRRGRWPERLFEMRYKRDRERRHGEDSPEEREGRGRHRG